MNTNNIIDSSDVMSQFCRICHGPGTEIQPLYHPCTCAGSIKHVHENCLSQWIKISGKKRCELCYYKFQFVPVFAPNMPPVQVSLTNLLVLIFRLLLKETFTHIRVSVLLLSWIFTIPLVCFRLFNYLTSDNIYKNYPNITDYIFESQGMISDTVPAFLVVIVLLIWIFTLFFIRDEIEHLINLRVFARRHHNRNNVLHNADENRNLNNEGRIRRPNAIAQGGNLNAARIIDQNAHQDFNNLCSDCTTVENLNPDNEVEISGSNKIEFHIGTSTSNNIIEGNRSSSTPRARNFEENRSPGLMESVVEVHRSPDFTQIQTSNTEPHSNQNVIGKRHNEICITRRQVSFQDTEEVLRESGTQENINALNTDRKIDRLSAEDAVRAVFENEAIRDGVENEFINHNDDDADNPPNNNIANNGNDMHNLAHFERIFDELVPERMLYQQGLLKFIRVSIVAILLLVSMMFLMIFMPFFLGNCLSKLVLPISLIETDTFLRFFSVTYIGYIIIAFILKCLQTLSKWIKHDRLANVLDFAYLTIRVALQCVSMYFIFPVSLGWWMQICTLHADYSDSKQTIPSLSPVNHWIYGISFTFVIGRIMKYIAEIVRSRAVAFMYYVYNPNRNLMKKLIRRNTVNYLRFFLASNIAYGIIIFLMMWIPIEIVKKCCPTFLPCNQNIESIISVNSELLMLQILRPRMLTFEDGPAFLLQAIRLWCVFATKMLNLGNFLLRDMPRSQNGTQDNNASIRKTWLKRSIRLGLLITLVFITMVFIGVICLTVPVWIGRKLIRLPLYSKPANDFFTAVVGFKFSWLFVRLTVVAYKKLKSFRLANVLEQLLSTQKFIQLTCLFLLYGLFPMFLGIGFESLFVTPVRISFEEMPIYCTRILWIRGLICMKVSAYIMTMGPESAHKYIVERLYNYREPFTKALLHNFILPCTIISGLCICVPYVTVAILPHFVHSKEFYGLYARHFYSMSLYLIGALYFSYGKMQNFKKIYRTIGLKEYVIGHRLINYDAPK